MKRIYTTANGKQVNLDALISENEETIAVGNMRVNARGDQLGPGGKIEVNKNQVMQDYYKLNTPVAVDTVDIPQQIKKQKDLEDDWAEPTADTITDSTENQEESNSQTKPALRGSLADSVAKGLPPEKALPKKSGPSRI
jgi:hypothetical protein